MSIELKILLHRTTDHSSKRHMPALSILSSIKKASPPDRKKRIFSFRDPSNERTRDQTVRLDFSQLPDYEYKAQRPTTRLHASERSNQLSPTHRTDFQYLPFIDPTKVRRDQISIYFEENQLPYQELVRKREVDKLIQLFALPMQIAQEKHNLTFFIEAMFLLAQFAFECEAVHKSTFFLKNCLIMAELTRAHPCATLFLRSLVFIFPIPMLKNFDQAKLLLEKALMYCWAYDFKQQEIQCYDMIGLCYFYQGDIEKASFFHEKWTNGQTEPEDSYYRRTARDFIQMYERCLPGKVVDFHFFWTGYLNLPFVNAHDSNKHRFDHSKLIRYNNCNCQSILDEITRQSSIIEARSNAEFIEFHLEIHEQSLKRKNSVKKAQLPKRIREISQKYQKNEDKYRFTHQIYENPLYKIPLDKFVAYRCRQSYSLSMVQQNINKSIAESKEPFRKSAQVYVKHQNQQTKQNQDLLLNRFKRALLALLE